MATAEKSANGSPKDRHSSVQEQETQEQEAPRPLVRSGLYRLGTWSAGHPIAVLLAWGAVILTSVLVAIVGVGGHSLFQRLENGIPEVNGEASQADALITAAEGGDGTKLSLLVYGVNPLDSDLGSRLDTLPARIAEAEAHHPGARLTVSDPRTGLAALESGVDLPAADSVGVRQATAKDGRGLLVSITVDADAADVTDEAKKEAASEALAALDDLAEQLRAENPGAIVHVSSDSRMAASYRAVAASDLERGEGIALPLALVIMVVVFGGFLAAGIPLVGALASIGSGFGALYVMSYFIGFDSMVINVISLLGLGLAIDYGLLVISRFREQVRTVRPGDRSALVHAVAVACERAGRTVVFSGTIFAAASVGLVMFEPRIMKTIGLGVITVVVLAVLLSITLLPALLSLAGFRLAKPGFLVRLLGENSLIGRLGEPAPGDGAFGRIARWVQRRPALTTIGSLLILAILASPALAMKATNDVSGALPRAASQYPFVDAVNTQFPDAARAQVKLVVRSDRGSNATAVAERWSESLRSAPAVEGVGVTTQSGEYATAVIHPVEGKGLDVVRQARDRAPDAAIAQTWVTGSAAHDLDLISSVQATAPWAALAIVAVTFILLFLMTGSIVVPLKSLFISVFSLGSAVGLLVWGFQEGNLGGLLNFEPADVTGVDILVLTITLALGFGLSMDYEVFLLGRVVELRDAGVPGREAIWRGVQSTGRIITSAALIMVVVFLGFTVGDLLVIKQMGTALAVLVALDATLVRLVLVPALMTWQERIMWWSPNWLIPVAQRFRVKH